MEWIFFILSGLISIFIIFLMLKYRKEKVSNDQPTSSNEGADRQQIVVAPATSVETANRSMLEISKGMANNNSSSSGTTNTDFDAFKALQLKPCSDKAQISKAYKQLALKLHPDKLEPGRTTDSESFLRLKKAYDFLVEKDAKALAEYAVITQAESGNAAQMRSLLRTLNSDAGELKRLLSVGLIIAAQNGHVEMARLLLEDGADPRETGTVTVDGQMINKVTPLRVAAFKGHLEMCKLLVAHGKANLLTRVFVCCGWSPSDEDTKRMLVCAACYGGHLDIVKHFGTGIDYCGRLAFTAASFHGRDEVLSHLLLEEKASAERSSDGGVSSSSSSESTSSSGESTSSSGESTSSSGESTSSSSSKSWREIAEPWCGILFIVGVVLLALAIIPAPACAVLLFATIFAFCKYRSELYEHLPQHFINVLPETYALYMEKLKRWFPDWQTLTATRSSWVLWIGHKLRLLPCDVTNMAKNTLDAISPIRPGLLNRARRVIIGAVLIFAVGSLLVYDLKAVVSTYILLAFVAVFVKFGLNAIKGRLESE